MKRLADEMVPLGLSTAWRRASWPTSRSPCSVMATTDGVVRDPSTLGTTVGWPPSTVAITEFVVPRSMPTALAMSFPSSIAPTSQVRPVSVSPSGSASGGCAYRHPLVAVDGDRHLVRLGLLGHRDHQSQHPLLIGSLNLVDVEAVTKEQLPAEGPLWSLAHE